MALLRFPPLFEVGIRDRLGQEAVDDHGVYPVVIEIQIRVRAPGLGYYHLLRVYHEPHGGVLGIGQDILDANYGLIEALQSPEKAILGERRQGPRPPAREGAYGLGQPPTYPENLLYIPAHL